MDLACVILALPGLLVLVPLIALAIKLASPGPVLFRQRRVGYQGQRFLMLKFRTMRPDADPTVHQRHMAQLMESDEPMRKPDDDGDDRVYPLGRFLRASGLDELPQFWNVIRGEMSIVGPRPCTEAELAGYQPWQMERFATPPGLTGLWQVSGKNGTRFSEMILLDLRYVQTRSLRLDLEIILRTPRVLVDQLRSWGAAKGQHQPAKGQAEALPGTAQRSPRLGWFRVADSRPQATSPAPVHPDSQSQAAGSESASRPPLLASEDK